MNDALSWYSAHHPKQLLFCWNFMFSYFSVYFAHFSTLKPLHSLIYPVKIPKFMKIPQ